MVGLAESVMGTLETVADPEVEVTAKLVMETAGRFFHGIAIYFDAFVSFSCLSRLHGSQLIPYHSFFVKFSAWLYSYGEKIAL